MAADCHMAGPTHGADHRFVHYVHVGQHGGDPGNVLVEDHREWPNLLAVFTDSEEFIDAE